MSSIDSVQPNAAAPADDDFAADVLSGLSLPQKALPCRWFYDARGSDLFERITQLPEYYPTRVETEILEAHAADIAAHAPARALLVEFGSGSSRKTEVLLSALPNLAAYAPIDVSRSALDEARERLRRRFPHLRVLPVAGDFSVELKLPFDVARAPRLGFFPGSTIGNFEPKAAGRLLTRFGKTLGAGARLVLGVDLRKPTNRLIPAYDDASGVTAAFNLNLLRRINEELGGDFDLSSFAHEAIWNKREGRIEMRLVSRRKQAVHILGGTFEFHEGERIHTENSYKHTVEGFQALASHAGWRALDCWTDGDDLFSVHVLMWEA